MHTDTYLNFDGQCEDAFKFYARIMGGEIAALMRWSDMPGGPANPAMANRVMHSHLKIGATNILGADAPPDRYNKPQGFNVTLNTESDSEAERVFAALGDGGTVTMEMQETFFATRFGMVTDRFGIPWMVIHGK